MRSDAPKCAGRASALNPHPRYKTKSDQPPPAAEEAISRDVLSFAETIAPAIYRQKKSRVKFIRKKISAYITYVSPIRVKKHILLAFAALSSHFKTPVLKNMSTVRVK